MAVSPVSLRATITAISFSIITVEIPFFANSKELDSVGGSGYLVDLTNNVISIVSIKDYGQMIYDLYLRRELITIGEDIVLDARKAVLDEEYDVTVAEAVNVIAEEMETKVLKIEPTFKETVGSGS